MLDRVWHQGRLVLEVTERKYQRTRSACLGNEEDFGEYEQPLLLSASF